MDKSDDRWLIEQWRRGSRDEKWQAWYELRNKHRPWLTKRFAKAGFYGQNNEDIVEDLLDEFFDYALDVEIKYTVKTVLQKFAYYKEVDAINTFFLNLLQSSRTFSVP